MNKPPPGIKVASVGPRSPAYRAGLRKGDIVLGVDGRAIADELDFRFFSARPDTALCAKRRGAERTFLMHRPPGAESGVRFTQRPIRRCANRCIFCFIDQMPQGLRKSLYVKDEDYRYSFTNGNYVTLSRASDKDLGAVIRMGLSPLYVSVHATQAALRSRMLGIAHARDILQQLRFLENNDIRFHAQIVVCPGVNDGEALKRTIADLLTLDKGLLSIAVVPVGLTRHRKIPLREVGREEASVLCRDIGAVSGLRKNSLGKRCIFLADELFIKAGLPIPPRRYYEDFPQIENGVGLVRQLMDDWKAAKRRIAAQGKGPGGSAKQPNAKKILLVTSQSALPFIGKIAAELHDIVPSAALDAIAVRNDFFGETVTVAGLMSGRDVIAAVKSTPGHYHCVVLPEVIFNRRGHTLDGFSAKRMEKCIGTPVRVVSSIGELSEYVIGKRRGN